VPQIFGRQYHIVPISTNVNSCRITFNIAADVRRSAALCNVYNMEDLIACSLNHRDGALPRWQTSILVSSILDSLPIALTSQPHLSLGCNQIQSSSGGAAVLASPCCSVGPVCELAVADPSAGDRSSSSDRGGNSPVMAV